MGGVLRVRAEETYRGRIRISVRVGLVRVIPLAVHQRLPHLFPVLPLDRLQLLLLLFLLFIFAFVTGVEEVCRELFLFDSVLVIFLSTYT